MPAFLIILFIGLFIRFLLIGNPGFVADISFWKSWGLAAYDYGIVWTSYNTNINYPPGFIYVLYIMTKIYSLFADPHNHWEFWRQNNFFFLFASKSIAIASDTAIYALIYFFLKQKDKLKKLGATRIIENPYFALTAAAIFFLNPIVILDSALWGQVESYGMIFTLLAMVLIFYNKPFPATFIYTIGTLMKLQNIIYLPIYFIFIARYYNLKTLAMSLGAACLSFFTVNLPFLLAGKMERVLTLMTVNNDYFPWLSLNAHNPWWIVSGARGMQVLDKITVLGIMNAKSLGLFLFSSFYLLAVLLILAKPKPKNFILSLTFGIYAFFLLMTQSHERYSYPVIVFLLLFLPFIGKIAKKSTGRPVFADIFWHNKYFFAVYFLFTVFLFFNMHMGLVANYPENGIRLLTNITTAQTTIANSALLTLMLFSFIPFFLTEVSLLFFLILPIALAGSILYNHADYLLKGKVSLTKFKYVKKMQGWGDTQINRSLTSMDGWKKWSRLAVDYMFYRKGFGSHAYSELEFDINRKFSRFETDMGVDVQAGTSASVIFKIFGDGRLLFESPKLGRFDFPVHANVDIKGVKTLKLVIEDAKDSNRDDHADWLNPVLIK